MEKRTINQVIIEVLKNEGKPLTIEEIYKIIREENLYQFRSKNPQHIVRTQLRRHSENLTFPDASAAKHFIFLGNNTYTLKK